MIFRRRLTYRRSRGGWVRFNEDGEVNGISKNRPYENLKVWKRIRSEKSYLVFVDQVCTVQELPLELWG